jgi:hypothetical protein
MLHDLRGLRATLGEPLLWDNQQQACFRYAFFALKV